MARASDASYRLHRPRTFHECNFGFAPLERGWPTFTAAHYASTFAYDAFAGRDLTPWNSRNYDPRSGWRHLKPAADPSLRAGVCSLRDRGTTWSVRRVGPFVSYGNYDWWQFSGRDAGALADGALRGGASAFIVESLIGAVDADGAPLPYPPLHLHHMHLLPAAERLRFHYNVSAPAGPPVGYLNNVVLERHGEWNHLGSTPVRSEAEREGYGRLISSPLDFDGELNDARPRGSPPLTWYLQIAVRWQPATAPLVPISVYNLLAVGPVTNGAQATFERYFWVPTAGMWLGVYSGALGGRAGRMLYLKPHAHMNLLSKAWVFAKATPEDVLTPAVVHALAAPRVAADTNEQGTALLRLDHKSGGLDLGDAALTVRGAEAAVLRRGVRPACVLLPNHLKVNGPTAGWYDRAPNISCTAWQFAPRERFTVVALLRFCGNGAPDDGAGRCPPEPWRAAGEAPPPALPMHLEIFLFYELPYATALRRSCYGFVGVQYELPPGFGGKSRAGGANRSSVAVVPGAWRSRELRESCSNFVPQRAPSSSSSLRVRNVVSWLAGSQIS